LIRLRNLAVGMISRVPARVQTKLLTAFLAMVTLLVLLGAVGLNVLSGMNERTEKLIELERKIAAYRRVQHDATRQLLGVSSALLSGDERALDNVLRQLSQFGYDLDRLQYVAHDEVELLGEVRQQYDRFIEIVTDAVNRARAGQVSEARELQLKRARPLASRLERLTNQLVNIAEADMVESIDASQQAYDTSRMVVVGLVLGSTILALALGYVFSWSIVGPLAQIEARLRQVAAGEFTQRVNVVNRDELGALADDLNRTCDELARLYGRLQRSVVEMETLGKVSREISSSLELQAVLGAIAAHAVALAEADAGAFYAYDEDVQVFRLQANHELDRSVVEAVTQRPVRLGEGAIGSAGLRRSAVQIPDIDQEAGYPLYDIIRKPGYRALLAVPLVRDDSLVGGLVICRKAPGAFTSETVDLVQTLANQSVLAIENAKLFEELEHKGRELASASRQKSEFLATMSHELRTPLNAILGFTELIQDGIYGEPSPKIHEILDRVEANGKHLLGLINDVLDLAKIEAGQLELNTAEYEMADVVRTVVNTTESLAAEKKLALKVELEPLLPKGVGDEQRLTQVVMNLVGNAIKFTDTGEVTVGVAARNGVFEVSVTDTGPGIPDEERRRIFEEFHQADSSATRKKGGTGLGLAIAERIVQLHGGRIWVDSIPDNGARFAFTIPVLADRGSAP